MNTLAWLLIFTGLMGIRQASKGRGITDIPGDLGKMTTAILNNDTQAMKDVLGAKGTAFDPVTVTTGVTAGAALGVMTASGENKYNLAKGTDPKLIPIANSIGDKWGLKTITGYRNNPGMYGYKDHASGKSIDLFTNSKEKGDAIAEYLTANATALNVRYVIWWQRIWYPGKGWAGMPDRGSDNNNHKNHVHLTIN